MFIAVSLNFLGFSSISLVINKKIQTTAKETLAATNTFRQRVPPYAGPRVRGYRAQEVRWQDKVDTQDLEVGEDGFLQAGGLAAYRDDDEVLKKRFII